MTKNTQMRTAMELAFKKTVEDGIARDKQAIKSQMFAKKSNSIELKPKAKERTIKSAPREGDIPVEKIQAAVHAVSKKDES